MGTDFCFPAQFLCKPKTALKHKVYFGTNKKGAIVTDVFLIHAFNSKVS